MNTVRFSLNGSDYIIDLSEDNAARFLGLLAPYVEAAQPDPAARTSATRAAGGTKQPNSRQIRKWAQAQNLQVSDRGVIPKHIIKAYNEAHSL